MVEGLAGHDSGMLWTLRFTGGRAEPFDPPGLDEPGDGWTWSHFPLGDNRARRFLAGWSALPASARTLLGADERRVQIQHTDDWAYGVLPDVERDLGGRGQDPGRLAFACDGKRLVTARLHALLTIDQVRRQAERGERIDAPCEAIAKLMLRYLDILGDQIETQGETIDDIEDMVLAERTDLDRLKLGPLRRELASRRRELQGLRGALHRAMHPRDGRQPGFLAEALSALPPIIDDLDREAAAHQDRARLLHEEIDTLINSATNRSIRALTIMSTLLIPPTLIVGAFGMNVPGIPFAGSHAGFALASVLCVIVVAAAWMLLKRMRLLN